VHARAVEAGLNITAPIDERCYQVDVAESGDRWQLKGPAEAGNRPFVLADPDGQLLRSHHDLGVRPSNS